MPARSLLAALVVAAAVLAGPARAEPPSQADIDTFESLVGFDELVVVALAKAGQDPDFGRLGAAERTCVLDKLGARIAQEMDRSVAEGFGTDEAMREWLRHARTPGGAKFVAHVRDGMLAQAQGRPKPDMAAFRATLAPQEIEDINAFVLSPAWSALQVIGDNFDRFDTDAFALEIADTCGIDPDSLK